MAKHHFTTLLGEFDIEKSDDFLKLAPDRKKNFVKLFYKSISKTAAETLANIRVAEGVKFHFRTGPGARNTPTNAFLAKSAFYANRTLITYPFRDIEDKRELEEFKDKHRSAREINTAHRLYVKGPPGSFKKGEDYKLDVAELREFIDLFISHRPAIESGVADVIPLFPHTENKVKNKRLGLLSANFSSRELHEQFFESQGPCDAKRESSPIVPRLLLPHFSNVPIERVLEIREREKKLYDEFQSKLKTLLEDASQAQSESKILGYMREVDTGVRELHIRFKEIKKKQRLKKLELSIGFSTNVLVPFIPIDPVFQHALKVVFGGTAIFQFFTAVNEFRRQESSLSDDQFYIQWLLFKNRS